MRNPKFLGVYSLKVPARGKQKPRFFVWQLPDGDYAIQELDAAMTQHGPARAVAAADLDRAFKAEPAILAAPVTTPDFRPLAKNRETAAKVAGEVSDEALASLEQARKARQLENDLRDKFAKAMRALSRPQDRKNALAVLGRIAAMREGIEPSHRHMFRDFGVALRKKSLPDLAVACARRVVALAPQDDHARFNLARNLGQAGKYDEAEAQLGAARKLDPNEKIYDRMAAHLAKERQKAAKMPDFDDDNQ